VLSLGEESGNLMLTRLTPVETLIAIIWHYLFRGRLLYLIAITSYFIRCFFTFIYCVITPVAATINAVSPWATWMESRTHNPPHNSNK